MLQQRTIATPARIIHKRNRDTDKNSVSDKLMYILLADLFLMLLVFGNQPSNADNTQTGSADMATLVSTVHKKDVPSNGRRSARSAGTVFR